MLHYRDVGGYRHEKPGGPLELKLRKCLPTFRGQPRRCCRFCVRVPGIAIVHHWSCGGDHGHGDWQFDRGCAGTGPVDIDRISSVGIPWTSASLLLKKAKASR